VVRRDLNPPSSANFQHKLARRLVNENQAIVVETLKIKNMQKQRCLAKAIGDAGWHSLQTKVAYKAERAGNYFVGLDNRAATSKTCSCCGFKITELPCARIGMPKLRNAA
jgi:putative transposase